MLAPDRAATVVGVFATRREAAQAAEELERLGWDPAQIDITVQDDEENTTIPPGETLAPVGGIAGLVAGGVVGGLLGAVAAALAPAGALVSGGVASEIVGGVVLGGLAGLLLGTLAGVAFPRRGAATYDQHLAGGRTLVTVNAAGHEREARAVLAEYGALNLRSSAQGAEPFMLRRAA